MSCNNYHYNHVSYHRRDHHPDLFKEKLLKKEDETLYLLLAGSYIMLSHVNYHKINKTWYVCLDKHVFSIQKNVQTLRERFFNFFKGRVLFILEVIFPNVSVWAFYQFIYSTTNTVLFLSSGTTTKVKCCCLSTGSGWCTSSAPPPQAGGPNGPYSGSLKKISRDHIVCSSAEIWDGIRVPIRVCCCEPNLYLS